MGVSQSSLVPSAASALVNMPVHQLYVVLAAAGVALFVALIVIANVSGMGAKPEKSDSTLVAFLRFFYASFLKPHEKEGTLAGQQGALESFYKKQVCTSRSWREVA